MNILNVQIYDDKLVKVIRQLLENCTSNSARQNYCISATGAHGLITAYNNRKFKEVLDYFFMNLPDGMPSVWIGRLKGAKRMQRCYGPDFFRDLIIASANTSVKHFFCGGKEGVAEELKMVCKNKFGNKNIVGVFSPPFYEMSDEELKNLAFEINSKSTDVVWIGLSTPKQEIFAYRLSKFTNVHYLCTVGAAFDFHTGKVQQAPASIQKIGMEWLFRLILEPRRLWKRYLEIVPLFIWYNIVEIFTDKSFTDEGESN